MAVMAVTWKFRCFVWVMLSGFVTAYAANYCWVSDGSWRVKAAAGILAGLCGLSTVIALHISTLRCSETHTLATLLAQYLIMQVFDLIAPSVYRNLKKVWKYPRKEQDNFLLKLLARDAKTEYGKRHGFSDIKSLQEFREKHPLTKYEHYRDYFTRLADGEKNVCVAATLERFGTSSGTTGKGKLIPMVTSSHFQKANTVLSRLLYSPDPVQKVAILYSKPAEKFTKSGERIAPLVFFPDSTISNFFMSAVQNTPPSGFQISSDFEATYVNMLFALTDKNMGQFFAPFASQVYRGLKMLEDDQEMFLEDLTEGRVNPKIQLDEGIRRSLDAALTADPARADELRREFAKGFVGIMARIWPHLVHVSTIDISGYMKNLEARYSKGVPLYTSGYGCTEGLIGVNAWKDKTPQQYTFLPNDMLIELIPEHLSWSLSRTCGRGVHTTESSHPDIVMVDQMLDEWGVSQLKDTFAENYIDAEALQFLSEEDIKQLIPQIGLRVKFMQNWKVHFQQKEVLNIPINLLQESSDVGSWISASFKQSDLNSSGSVSTQPDLFSDSASSTETLFPSSQMAPAKRQRKCLFDVKNILNNTVGGQNVIQHIRTHGFLSKKMRHNLVSILVSHLMETHGKNPSAYVKSALADSVITVFPQLKDPQGITGYEAFYTKGASKCPASGYLEEHLRYVRKQLIQRGLSTKASEKITAKSGAEADPDVEPLEMSDSTKDKIQWLKDNTEPATKVIDYMRESLKYRREWINDKARTVREIIAEYPRLLDEGMIEEEYKMMYPDHADRLMDNWTSIKSSIIEFGIQHCSVWKEVLQLTCSDYTTLSEDQQTNLSLFFLPLIFEGQRKAAGGRCFSSNASKREAFIDTQPDITNIPAYLKKIDSEKRPQPFILALHRDVSELQPTDIFVIVEKQALPQSSLLKAVDICYKLHFVLDCSYQDSCKGLWSFFQSFVFKQALKGRKESNTMRALRAFISYKTLTP